MIPVSLVVVDLEFVRVVVVAAVQPVVSEFGCGFGVELRQSLVFFWVCEVSVARADQVFAIECGIEVDGPLEIIASEASCAQMCSCCYESQAVKSFEFLWFSGVVPESCDRPFESDFRHVFERLVKIDFAGVSDEYIAPLS